MIKNDHSNESMLHTVIIRVKIEVIGNACERKRFENFGGGGAGLSRGLTRRSNCKHDTDNSMKGKMIPS